MATADLEHRLPGVRLRALTDDSTFPVFVEPESAELSADPEAAIAWFAAERGHLDALTTQVGAVVLRGFAFRSTDDFARIVDEYPPFEGGYVGGASPRKGISARVFEATRSPAPHLLPLHQEMAYLPTCPNRVAFYCRVAATKGGETIICDMRRFDRSLPDDLRRRVQAHGVLYVRNFRSPAWSTGDAFLDVYHRPWSDVFETDDPDAALAACTAIGLEGEWVGDSLSVRYRAPGFVVHPVTGESIWFNQISAQAPAPSSLPERPILSPTYRAEMFESYGDRPRPYETRYGDGSPIPEEDVLAIHDLHRRGTVAFPWEPGDVMLLDNYLAAHGRNPYEGERDVQVGLLGVGSSR
jgi:hypothetical protein